MRYYARIGFAIYLVVLFFVVIWLQPKQLGLNLDIGPSSKIDVGLKTWSKLQHGPRRKFINMRNEDDNLIKIENIRKEIKMKNGRFSDSKREPFISHLLSGQVNVCNDNFIGYKNKFAKLANVVIDPKFGEGRQGGENISDVLNQSEESEYYKLKPGFFQTPCRNSIVYDFGGRSYLNDWIKAIRPYENEMTKSYKEVTEWTIALQRHEYVNMYHTMTDWFNTYLVTKVFHLDPKNVTILWIDGHPDGGLDSVWRTIFGKVVRIGEIREPVKFSNMIWGIVGYDSLIEDHFSQEVPYLEDFRTLFLSSFGVTIDDQLDCDKLNVLLIWRRDYVAHPRNPSGSVARKIKNEDELFETMTEVFEGHNVKAMQIDLLPMSEQLSITSKTDILIGMHGAGLSHSLFLPRHAGLIEMFPIYHPNQNMHFKAMATWRHLYYSEWSNYDPSNELENYYTIVDVESVTLLAQEMRTKMCHS
ncbi:hypothetical protein ACF0H5_002158 [Mactra antiquata]